MMEDEKTNKHGKKKINTSLGSITIGGEGGITGLLVFGGALAIAGFMAVTSFGTRKHKKKAVYPHHQQILLEENKDSLVQYSTTQFGDDVTSCFTSNEGTKTVSSSELQPLILEEKVDNEPNSACFHPQEIAFSDHSHPESARSSNENGVAEECPVLLFNNNSGDHEQEEEKDESQDSLTNTETEEDDDDDVMETDEEDSSIATETTSLDDKEELIEQEYKKYYCENNLCNEEEMTVQKEAILNKTANLSVVQNYQPSILRTWVMPMLMLGLLMLLVLLTRGLQESLYVLDDGIL